MENLKALNTPALHDLYRQLCRTKHKGSPGRRITSVERDLGQIKHELKTRQKQNHTKPAF